MTSLTPSSRLKASVHANCINGQVTVPNPTPPPPPAPQSVTFPCKDVDLLAWLDNNSFGGVTGSDIEGWTDPTTGKEWVVMGHSDATTFIDVTDPHAPIVFGSLLPIVPTAIWREIEVYNNHAYIVQDLVGVGVQIFDLTKLRSAAPGVVYGPLDYTTDASFGNAHTITINADTGFAYVNGSDTCSAASRMFDLKPNPKVPVFVGCVLQDGYTHDNQCVVYHGPDTTYTGREICAMYNEDTLTIFDVTNKSASVMLSRTGYTTGTGKYTHQGWFTEDHRYILLDDELDENGAANNFTRTYLWNMADLNAPVLITPWRHQTLCTDHNQFIIERFSYQSNYACGLRIMDVTDVGAGKLTQVAYFDTSPAHDFIAGASDGGDLDGDWANYPYFESGIVVSSNISKGLFVLRPHLPSATGSILFSEDLEPTPVAGWTFTHEVDGTGAPLPGNCAGDEWHVTMSSVHGGTRAWTNNPYTQAFQADHCFNYLTTPPFTIPSGMSGLTLTFWEHHFTEGPNTATNPCNPPTNDPPCDFGEVQLTNDGGANWSTISDRYEGGLPTDPYDESSLPLGDQAGKTIQLRFKFTSDAFAASPPFDGWFIDDIEVRGSAPTAVMVASFTAKAAGRTGVEVSWRTGSEADTLGFNVWRYGQGKGVKVNRTLIGAKAAGRAGGATYRLADRSAQPGAKYTYKLQVVSKDGRRAWSASTAVRVRR